MTSDLPTPSAEPEADDARVPPSSRQDGHPDQSGTETPGDLDAPDIVGPTGEEMPVQRHARVGADPVQD